MKSIKLLIVGLFAIPMFAFSVGLTTPALASEIDNGATTAGGGTGTPTDLKVVIKNITNTALFIIGAVSVLMLIYGGIRYTISGGDEKSITAAKNTIIYGVVGIVVAISAYAIVNFVITALK
jgi:hypothetical protein